MQSNRGAILEVIRDVSHFLNPNSKCGNLNTGVVWQEPLEITVPNTLQQ
jgi:hypothetical protein